MANETVLCYDSLLRGGAFRGYLMVESWTHEAGAEGGWLRGTCSLKCDRIEAMDWLDSGLGRHIVLMGNTQVQFEGFVNEISVQVGTATLTRGPLLDMANRVMALYSIQAAEGETLAEEDTGRLETLLVDDAVSQGLFGVVEKYVSAGTISGTRPVAQAAAERIRDAFLELNATPAAGINITAESSGGVVELGFAGYVAWLSAYQYFNDTDAQLVVSAQAKVLDILGQDPNSFVSSDYSGVMENDLLVPAQSDYDSALSALAEVMTQGGAAYTRYILGVYTERKLYYQPVPSAYAYIMRVSDAGVRLYTADGAAVAPYEVRPGQWIFMPDFIPRAFGDFGMAGDPRYFFIEHLTYTAPAQLELQSGATSSTRQFLRTIGLITN